MARPREFDPDNAVEKAMQVFWAKGYEATSLDDLCEATGLGRSSLYAAFGDKRALLLQSLDRYIERGAARISRAMADGPIHKSLFNLLQMHIDEIVAGPGRRGCFIGNCTAELVRHDPEVMTRVRAGLDRNEATYRAALNRAKANAEIPAKSNVDGMARFLIASVQGLRLVGKTNPDRAALNDIAKIILRCLDR